MVILFDQGWASMKFTEIILIRRNIYTVIFKFNLIKSRIGIGMDCSRKLLTLPRVLSDVRDKSLPRGLKIKRCSV